MKKFVSVVLSFVMVVSMLSAIPVTAFALDDYGFCGDYVEWEFYSYTGTVTLSGSGATYNYDYPSTSSPFCENADIKAVIVEDGITRIGDYLFAECPNLETVTIGNDVETIGEGAFCGCEKLSSVTFGNRVKTLEFGAFSDCKSLVNLNLPNSLETIENLAFDGCSGLVNVVVPDSVKSLGSQAFYVCTSLKTVSLGKVETIGDAAFAGCSALTELVIPKTVTSIAPGAFSSVEALASIAVDSENPVYDSRNNCNAIIETATNKLVLGCQNTVIPASVTVLEDGSFSGLTFESFTVPEGITTIETGAFAGCDSLKTLRLPKSLKTVNRSAFLFCTAIKEVYYAGSETDKTGMFISDQYGYNDYFINATWYYDCTPEQQIGDSVFYRLDGDTLTVFGSGDTWDYSVYNKSPLENNAAIKTVNVGDGITGLGDRLFYCCTNLKTVSLPTGLKTIGQETFAGCIDLTAVNLPEGLTTIGGAAFLSCDLSKLYIPSTVITVKTSVFENNDELATVYLSKKTTRIYSNAFENCTFLHDVYYTGSRNNQTNIQFQNGNGTLKAASWHYNCEIGQIGQAVYYCLDGNKLEVFGSGEMWDFVPSGNPSPFQNNTDIKTVTIGNGITNVGASVFHLCKSIETVYLPDSIKTLEACAFKACYNLTTINLPEGLTAIGTSAFDSCSGLPEISLPSTVTEIGENAFGNCTNLTSFSIPSGVTTIQKNTFNGCTGLETVYLDKNTTTVEDNAFRACSYLLHDVYYTGSAADKAAMTIGATNNDTFIGADWHLNYNPMKGTGSAADPYQITDYTQLLEFAAKVNSGNQKDACGKLMNDITCKHNNSDTDYAADWTPIGTGAGTGTAYAGTFDGQNKVITGLTTPEDYGNDAGLFGYVGAGGTVQNVGVEDAQITGRNYIGGIAGLNRGTVTNCYIAGTVTGLDAVGGIAGQNYGTVANCHNACAVTATSDTTVMVGGVVGTQSNPSNETAVIRGCYNTGAVKAPQATTAYIGGIVGQALITKGSLTVQNCYNTGAVTSDGDSSCAGGIGGQLAAVSNATITTKNCYNIGTITATGTDAYVGGVMARYWSGGSTGQVTLTNCYNAGVIHAASGANACVGGVAGEARCANNTLGQVSATNCYFDKTLCGNLDAIDDESTCSSSSVRGLTTAQMTGTAANDAATVKALFDAKDDNGDRIWLDAKANGEENGTVYLYYPHLRGFNCKADGTLETDSDQILAADWPAKVAVSVTWSGSDEYTYNASAQSPTVTAVTFGGKQLSASDYTVKYQEKNVFDTYDDVDTPLYAGQYKAIVTVTGTSLTFEKAFTINQAELTITPKTQTYTYNGSAQGEYHAIYTTDLDKKVTVEGLQGADTLRSIELDGHVTTAGEHPGIIRPSKADIGDATFSYHITYKGGAVMMNRAEITITAASDSWTYDGNSHENTAVAVTSGTLVAGHELVATATGSVKNVADTATGNNPVAAGYKIMNGDTDVTNNYAITAVAGTLTVTPVAVTITAASDAWTYDGQSHGNTAVTITDGALLTGDELVAAATGSVKNVTDTVTGNNPVAAGYKILHGDTDVTDNYSITTVDGTLTVTPKDVTVKANDINIKYGDTEPELTATITGVVGSDSVTFDLTRAAGDEVGEYTITASGDEDQGNYKVAYQNGVFNIAKADAPTLAADEKPTANTLVEDGTAQALVSAPASLPTGYTGVEYKLGDGDWSGDIPTATDAGDYNVHVRYTGDSNHSDFVGDSVSVHVKALYTVTWYNDGSEFAKKTFAEDEEEPTVTDIPTKEADKQYTYTFNEWFKDDSSTVSNVIYNAIYTNTLNKYTVDFVDEDGTVLQSEELDYGATPDYTGNTPTKEKTAEFTYTFDGWDADIENVTGDATYTATYTETRNTYTVTFVDDDGTVLQSEELEYGATPEFKGKEPTKAATSDFTYTFDGWDEELEAVTGNATYTATYTKTKIEKKPAGDDVPPAPINKPTSQDNTRVDERLALLGDGSNPTSGDATPEYAVNGGSKLVWEQDSEQDLVIPVKCSVANKSALTHFKRVLIDGKPFAAIANFRNDTVTIPAGMLSVLLPGTHKLTLVFDDGLTKQELEIELEVESAVKVPSVGAAAPTATPAQSKGFDKKHLLWIVPVSVAGVLTGAVVGTKKRRKKK